MPVWGFLQLFGPPPEPELGLLYVLLAAVLAMPQNGQRPGLLVLRILSHLCFLLDSRPVSGSTHARDSRIDLHGIYTRESNVGMRGSRRSSDLTGLCA